MHCPSCPIFLTKPEKATCSKPCAGRELKGWQTNEHHPQDVREGGRQFPNGFRLAEKDARRDACADDAHDPFLRRGHSGGRARHMDHIQCRRRSRPARRMRRRDRRLLRGGRTHDRFLADVRLLAAGHRLWAGETRPARDAVFRRQGLDVFGRRRAGADRAVAPLLGRAALRPRAGPQPRRHGRRISRPCSP